MVRHPHPLFESEAEVDPAASAIRYLDEHVRAGYKFLMQNYRTGDKICLFGVWALCVVRFRNSERRMTGLIAARFDRSSDSGFSRGAYTARALAGLLHKVSSPARGSDEVQERVRSYDSLQPPRRLDRFAATRQR